MKKLPIILLALPALAFGITAEQKESFLQQNIQVLKEKGLITPDSGVRVTPRNTLSSPSWTKSKDIADAKQMAELGYIKEDSSRAKYLLHFKDIVKKNAAIEAKMNKPEQTYLRKKTEDMKMAYSYFGVKQSFMDEYIGIAPVGAYVKSPQEGWSGAVQFFKSDLGMCAFTENNIEVSHGAARVAEESARYDINGKISLVNVTGTDASGYLYSVKWFDNTFIRELECANNHFSKQTTAKLIEMAKKVDSS